MVAPVAPVKLAFVPHDKIPEEEENCSICYEQLSSSYFYGIFADRVVEHAGPPVQANAEEAVAAPKTHKFHQSCIMKWTQETCPLCRIKYDTSDVITMKDRFWRPRNTSILGSTAYIAAGFKAVQIAQQVTAAARLTFTVPVANLIGKVVVNSSVLGGAVTLVLGALALDKLREKGIEPFTREAINKIVIISTIMGIALAAFKLAPAMLALRLIGGSAALQTAIKAAGAAYLAISKFVLYITAGSSLAYYGVEYAESKGMARSKAEAIGIVAGLALTAFFRHPIVSGIFVSTATSTLTRLFEEYQGRGQQVAIADRA